MLRIKGSPLRLCDGWTRRDFLHAGGRALGGLALAALFRLQEAAAARPAVVSAPHFGKAKSCILLYLYGSPSQLETFDPKPDAPVEIRGELKSIRSALPGCDVNELLPHAARVMDRVTVVRSVKHPYPIHGVAYATTGAPATDIPMELNPQDGRHWPFLGSVVDYVLQSRRAGGREPPVSESNTGGSRPPARQRTPDNVALPFPFSS